MQEEVFFLSVGTPVFLKYKKGELETKKMSTVGKKEVNSSKVFFIPLQSGMTEEE